MSTATAPDACPRCGSEMWDNRSDKLSERSPDYRCKDQHCGGAVWLSGRPAKRTRRTPERAGGPNGNGRSNGTHQRPIAPQKSNGAPAGTPGICSTYLAALDVAIADVVPRLKHAGFQPTAADVLASAATIFIAKSREHGR